MSTNAGPNSRAGKPLNVGDACTIVGTILTVAQTTPETQAVVTVQLASSGNTVSVQAFDIAASTQTL
jgi:hypothetical protein